MVWVLKADVHRGEGLRFAPARQAAADALRPSAGGDAWALAQRFVAPQLLFDQRPFYIRHALTLRIPLGSQPLLDVNLTSMLPCRWVPSR